ncbi:MAG: DegT/DnrJ/EryC1/StrS family aminotransferase [Planctomycetota bacterium]|jgi:dTDP-4-amino-4,6-dideoxygalactose transaminase
MEQAAIPVFEPHLGVDTLKAVTDAFDVGWIGMGATTRAFEQALAARLGTDRPVVATMTGTDALHLALRLAGVGPGDEVILPSFNFIADVQAVLWTGAEPVFADIEETTLGLDPACAAELVTPRTKAIMPLHFAGVPCAIASLRAIAAAHGLRVVEDATHALGSSAVGVRIGAAGDLTCFSFDPVKIITSLDGGAVVCGPDDDVTALHRLRLLGIDTDTQERYRNRRAWEYDVTSVGFRAHMTNINAAIGLSQLARLDTFIARRRADCRAYQDAFADLDWLATPATDFEQVAPFIYTVRVRAGAREPFIAHLRGRGVAAGIHFLPCHEKSLCRPLRRGPLPVTERVGVEIVTLPLWSAMPRDTRDRVIEAVRSFHPATVTAVAVGSAS